MSLVGAALSAPVRAAAARAVVLAAALLPLPACGDAQALRDPSADDLAEVAPDSFVVDVRTSAGDFEMTLVRAWSPLAVDRVHYLADHGFFDGARFYRVNGQYAQFGYSGQPALDSVWSPLTLPDEPVRASNVRGAVTFARAGPASRNFVLFINLTDNTFLDAWAGDGVAGFPPIGRVSGGMEVADALNDAYGDEIMMMEDSILELGNAFLDRRYPGLDSIVGTNIVRSW